MKTIIIGENQSINQAFSELLNSELSCCFSFIKPANLYSNGHPAEDFTADLILIDLSSSISNSRNFLQKIRQMKPLTPIIALHFYTDIALAEELIQAGASAYLLINTSSLELNNAIQHVLEGKKYISKDILN
ncbi:MAG: response regulator transcription factor [Bacteroidales bacterium]|nr:response regulator transcription factor [Bacteroidales bacterium]